ncbi:hypothetical protein EC957_002137 [Mortierella hygrophila]|uniref:NADH:flavin oxidoreductase/NADH oxidase N-terminal domain-containing protein n=1 Tax=Mortierella hygrophila TaxID=979708 RepID=A0A9P6F5Q0_9FUNG|nr:hypothetical protein EC957_002137 [Mortierella hygrophila]
MESDSVQDKARWIGIGSIRPQQRPFHKTHFESTPPVALAVGTPTTVASTLPLLFHPITIKNLTIADRIAVAPMSMYSSKDGLKTDFQLVHLGSYALHGERVGLYAVEARDGPGIGLLLGWPSLVAAWRHIPRAVSIGEIQDVVEAFGAAAVRTDKAEMDTVEIQGAYGYLIHTFLSPLASHRTDGCGGSLENRARTLFEVVKEVRANFRGNKPLEKIPRFPGYQVHYAARIRQDVPGLAVVAVGTINSGKQAQEIVESEKADLVAATSAFLRHPTFALGAGRELSVDVTYAPQYVLTRYA